MNRLGTTVIAIFIAWSIALSSLGQQTVANRQEMREKRVKKITEFRFRYADGYFESEGTRWGYHEFDVRGNHIVNGRYSAGGGTPQGHPMYLREYDEADRPIKRIWYCNRTPENPEGSICLVFKDYKLDEHGNVVEECGYDPDGRFVARVTFQRDELGRPLERVDYVQNDQANQKKYVYKYTDRLGKIETSVFDHKGVLVRYTLAINRFDDEKNIVETKYFDENGNFTECLVHRYDEAGLRTETITVDRCGKPIQKQMFLHEFHGR